MIPENYPLRLGANPHTGENERQVRATLYGTRHGTTVPLAGVPVANIDDDDPLDIIDISANPYALALAGMITMLANTAREIFNVPRLPSPDQIARLSAGAVEQINQAFGEALGVTYTRLSFGPVEPDMGIAM